MKILLKPIIFNVFLLKIAFFIEAGFAQESINNGFADYLFMEGEYYRAITEYYRILYHENDPAIKIQILRKIGLCYFNGASYEEYIAYLTRTRVNFKLNSLILNEMELYLGKSYYFLGQYPKAITNLEWTDIPVNNVFYDETQFLLGISYARIFDWHAAIKKMHLIQQNSPFKKVANNFIQYKVDFDNLANKSPLLSGLLSTIIPGTGYVYSARMGTGFTSFLLNGLLIWTIRDAIVHEQYGLALATSFFGIGWYIGNIKGSIAAAESYNARIRHNFIDNLLKQENLQEYIKP